MSSADRLRGVGHGGPPTVPVTCLTDGRSHAVAEGQLVASGVDGGGHYRALCGHVVVAASLAEPDGHPCRACAAL